MLSPAARLLWIGFVAAAAACSSATSAGGEGQHCYGNDTCNAGLVCTSRRCVKAQDGAAGADGAAGGDGAAGATASDGGEDADGAAGSDGAADATDAMDAVLPVDADAATDAKLDAATDASDDAGTDAAPADGGDGAAGAPGCDVTSVYAPLTFAASAQEAFAVGDPATTTAPLELDWDAPLNNDAKPDILDIVLFKGQAPFKNGITADDFDLAGQNDFRNCGACVLVIAHADTSQVLLKAGDDYIAKSGTLSLKAVPTLPLNGTSRLTGTLTNVVLEHVQIHPSSYATTKVDDCTITLKSVNFSAIVKPSPK
jgi:hypothetical protein